MLLGSFTTTSAVTLTGSVVNMLVLDRLSSVVGSVNRTTSLAVAAVRWIVA